MRSNWIFVHCTRRNRSTKYSRPLFPSGTWVSRYYQYGKWHDPYELELSFDSENCQVTGSGSDDVGQFIIVGIYSTKTLRMGLKKTYKYGTGNPRENLGHTVAIQLKWNQERSCFLGKWFVQTSQYHGENMWELKFHEIDDNAATSNV